MQKASAAMNNPAFSTYGSLKDNIAPPQPHTITGARDRLSGALDRAEALASRLSAIANLLRPQSLSAKTAGDVEHATYSGVVDGLMGQVMNLHALLSEIEAHATQIELAHG